MTGLLDTNVLVRYLTGDPPALAAKAAKIIDARPGLLLLTGVVLAETAYVLMRRYRLPREDVADHLISFVQRENVALLGLELEYIVQGLEMCRPSGRVSFPDALIWATARSSRHELVYSFDRRFPSQGITVDQEA